MSTNPYTLDTSLDWYDFPIEDKDIFPQNFAMTIGDRIYAIQLAIIHTKNETFLVMEVADEYNNQFRRKVVTGIMYRIGNLRAIFTKMILDPNSLIKEGDVGTSVQGYVAADE